MRLSTRNQLSGTMASITKDAAEELGVEVGNPASVLIKSTEVMIGVE
jgi:molybdopterin-binding protein